MSYPCSVSTLRGEQGPSGKDRLALTIYLMGSLYWIPSALSSFLDSILRCLTWSNSPDFFWKQKSAYGLRISDWSSDVCSSDLIGMGQIGLSANLMSRAGLAIGIGMMVEGAVVMVENAFRIMAERQAHGEKVDRTSAVLAAAKEVASPIAFAITIIIVVFLPLFSLEGLEGKMFKPMAFTIAFAMAGSMLLSLT